MARERRLEIPGGIYHVIVRGIERREIFKDDADREEIMKRFGETVKKTGCKCYGWVLMPNHFHLLIRTGKHALSEVMRKVLTGYAIYFNHRHKRSGYLYQNRYKSILCQEEAYFIELVRYIHLNPLRGNLVKNIEELKYYPWSGHTVLAGKKKVEWQSTGEVLEHFGSEKKDALRKYFEFIKEGQRIGKRDELTGGGLKRSAGGWAGVFELRRNKEYWRGDERILGDGDFVNQVLIISDEEITKKEKLLREGWNIERLVKKVGKIFGIGEEEIRSRRRTKKIAQTRGLIAYWGQTKLWISGSELARYFGISRPSVSEAIERGERFVKQNNINLIT